MGRQIVRPNQIAENITETAMGIVSWTNENSRVINLGFKPRVVDFMWLFSPNDTSYSFGTGWWTDGDALGLQCQNGTRFSSDTYPMLISTNGSSIHTGALISDIDDTSMTLDIPVRTSTQDFLWRAFGEKVGGDEQRLRKEQAESVFTKIATGTFSVTSTGDIEIITGFRPYAGDFRWIFVSNTNIQSWGQGWWSSETNEQEAMMLYNSSVEELTDGAIFLSTDSNPTYITGRIVDVQDDRLVINIDNRSATQTFHYRIFGG